MTRTAKDEPGTSAAAVAFSRGCDARIAGKRQSDNPYDHDDPLWASWKQGYKDCQTYWGVQAVWEFKDLPPVE